MTTAPPVYSVVVPVFNEQENIRPLIERVSRVMREQVGQPFEILFVDDGSRDATPVALRAAVREFPQVRAVRFTRNYGQEAAVQAGYKHARGSWILQMDGDLQNPPEDIPKLLALQAEGYDIVYGVRKNRKDPIFRKAASQAMRFVMRRMLDIELPEDISTFRLMRASTAKLLADLPEKNKFLSALACWVGAKYTTVDVGHAARAAGHTKYNLTKLVNHTFDLVVGFSSKPLRYVGVIGMAIATMGLAVALWAIGYKLFVGQTESGWASVISLMAVLGGMQLVALSLIGEYIARIYIQTQARPTFLVGELLEHEPEPEAALAAPTSLASPTGPPVSNGQPPPASASAPALDGRAGEVLS
jgi:glycosyltransferase involved in cell wall biosynthesis